MKVLKKRILKKGKKQDTYTETFIVGLPISFFNKRETKLIIASFIAGTLMSSFFWLDRMESQKLSENFLSQTEYCNELGKILNSSSSTYIRDTTICQTKYCENIEISGFNLRQSCLILNIDIGQPKSGVT